MARSTHHPAYKLFLDALRAARAEVGVTQVELAGRLDNLQVFVSKLERGERRLDVVDLYVYCQAAGIDFGNLMIQLEKSWQAMSPEQWQPGKLSIRSPRRRKKASVRARS